ncbi:MAG: histidine--tRNA ligase [Campylobacteraceae bacterium]|jgi:histidyl-tRNA synthetase|nr:histidine--tRNA ligase [Campylobacteraceae bacterium]
MINALRGMKDLLLPESEKYLYFIENCSRIAKNYGFEFISTPILEESALFKRSVGESSDIVGKEMYEFIDKGDNKVCLRPEGTAGIVRSFIQNKTDRTGGVKRFFYYGPMFRYEKPQKGRFRQFYQFGVESFGVSDVKEDAAIILMLNEILNFFKIKTVLKLNSLGCSACMPSYRIKLVKFLDSLDGLCDDCMRRKVLNPIRVLDCKNAQCQSLLTNAPLLIDALCDECKSDFENLKSILDKFHINYEIDPKLVRGLDYYSKTAFEFVSADIGAQSSIAGGGRYDRLVEILGGKPTPAIGFAIGVDRILELVFLDEKKRDGIYIGTIEREAQDLAFLAAVTLRRRNKVDIEFEAKGLKNILKNADKANAKYCVCIGENELRSGILWVKNLDTKENFGIKKELLGEFTW